MATVSSFEEGPKERRRLLDKLVREVLRCEQHAIEHAPREARRIGAVPPVDALREVAEHASAMRGRLERMLTAHDVSTARGGFAATLATLRHIVVDRVVDPERAYRTALLDLRHGIDVVRLLREIARHEGLFGIIRWCDDWLTARRPQVARVEAQLSWFVMDANGFLDEPQRIAPSPMTPAHTETSEHPFELDIEPDPLDDRPTRRDRR